MRAVARSSAHGAGVAGGVVASFRGGRVGLPDPVEVPAGNTGSPSSRGPSGTRCRTSAVAVRRIVFPMLHQLTSPAPSSGRWRASARVPGPPTQALFVETRRRGPHATLPTRSTHPGSRGSPPPCLAHPSTPACTPAPSRGRQRRHCGSVTAAAGGSVPGPRVSATGHRGYPARRGPFRRSPTCRTPPRSLRDLPDIGVLPEAALTDLEEAGRVLDIPEGWSPIHQSEPADKAYVVLAGEL